MSEKENYNKLITAIERLNISAVVFTLLSGFWWYLIYYIQNKGIDLQLLGVFGIIILISSFIYYLHIDLSNRRIIQLIRLLSIIALIYNNYLLPNVLDWSLLLFANSILYHDAIMVLNNRISRTGTISQTILHHTSYYSVITQHSIYIRDRVRHIIYTHLFLFLISIIVLLIIKVFLLINIQGVFIEILAISALVIIFFYTIKKLYLDM